MAEEPQAKKQHPVPQEVFSVQFKLVGDLTLRQFGFLMFFGVLAFILFSINIFFPIKLVLSAISLLIGIGFAFVPIQDQPMDQWIGAFFRAIYTPTRRLWIKSAEPAEFLTVEIPKLAYAPEPGVAAEESKRRLKTFLATVKEEQLSPLDLEEQQSLESIKTLAREVMAPTLPPPSAKALGDLPPAPPAPPEAAKPPEKPAEEAPPPPALPELRFIEVQKIQKRPSLASRINWGGETVYKVQRGEAASYFTTRKNVRVGRRLTPLAISGQEVYAPVREKVLEPELPSAPTLPQMPALQPAVTPPPPLPIPTPPPAPPAPKPKPEVPQEGREQGEKARDQRPRPMPAAPEKPVEKAPPPLAVKKLPRPKPKKEAVKEMIEANIVSGIVHNGKGGVLEKVLLIIKDPKGNVVRAIKANDLGRFQTTPLPNGSYSLELPKAPVPFATIKFELTGEKMEELDINPKK